MASGDDLAFERAGTIEVEPRPLLRTGNLAERIQPSSPEDSRGGDFALQAGDQELLLAPVLHPGPLAEPTGRVIQLAQAAQYSTGVQQRSRP
jgi:hypothetical protein